MKRDNVKRFLYVLISLFLLCNFFQVAKDNSYGLDYSLDKAEAITIHVPNGAHLEIKSEKNSSDILNSGCLGTTKSASTL